MATYYRILGQAKNTTSLAALLYHADPLASTGIPAATTVQTIISTITVCNTSSTPQSYQINIHKSETTVTSPGTISSLAADNSLVYGSGIGANETIVLTLGLTLDTHDRISVNASGASSSQNVNFFAFGLENRQ